MGNNSSSKVSESAQLALRILTFLGVAYQLIADDPLVDKEQCRRDANLMKQLGANSIRVYHVDAAKDHTDCMKIFEDAGIYIWADMDTFTTYIKMVRMPSTSFQLLIA